jgi:hypothetical protein
MGLKAEQVVEGMEELKVELIVVLTVVQMEVPPVLPLLVVIPMEV